jgi:hypothetical protein
MKANIDKTKSNDKYETTMIIISHILLFGTIIGLFIFIIFN